MGGKSSTSSKQEDYNPIKLGLENFQKETPRKMTCHILSNKREDCIKFIEFFTKEKIFGDELKEENIEKKINLYSFMNYKVYEDVSELMNKIKKKIDFVSDNPASKKAIYSEVIIILENESINDDLGYIRNFFKKEKIDSYYFPFLLIISPKKIDLNSFEPSKTFQYKFTLQNLYIFLSEYKSEEENKSESKQIKKNENKIKQKGKNEKKNKKENKINEKGKNENKNEINKMEIQTMKKNKKNKNELKESKEINAFIRKLYVAFSYYNELGDEFSFINSDGKEELIKIENDTNIGVFMDILLMGESGSGKSTLINLILGELKALEGGTGLSTTSKNLIIYKKNGIPLRLYDVKGIENDKTVDNYIQILHHFNGNNFSFDDINVIFYCIEYSNGTILKEMESILVEHNIPIIFIITKCLFNPYEECKDEEQKKEREKQINKIKNAIKSKIKIIFEKKEKENDSENFIKNYVKFEFVNLIIRKETQNPIPVFGIDKVLSYFKESIPMNIWEELIKSCLAEDENKCKEYCSNNPLLKKYSEFTKIRENNINEAKVYLRKLKASAFFSGIIPGFDIGMEYFYKYQFKKKLKSLYGYEFYKAKENLNEEDKINLIENEENIEEKELLLDSNDLILDESIKQISCIKEKEEGGDTKSISSGEIEFESEEDLESKISETENNAKKNIASFLRGLVEAGSIAIKILPTAGRITLESGEIIIKAGISAGLKLASWIFLPVSCLVFSIWSFSKIHRDCNKILQIFDKAFLPLKFHTLFRYVQSFLLAIEYLDLRGKKIIQNK